MLATSVSTGTLALEARVVAAGGTTETVLERRLAMVAEAVSERYTEILASAIELPGHGRLFFRVNLEDAPRGLFDGSARLVEMICELTLRLTPVKCRFAMIPSEMGTPHETSEQFDSAFEEATNQRLFLAVQGFNNLDDRSLTGVFAGIGVLLWGWTERQAQFVRALLREGVVEVLEGPEPAMRFLPERKRREIAAFFKVSPSVVTECLQAAKVKRFRYEVWAAADMLRRVLQ
ncbi:MAG: hypothetical protein O3A95_06775 [Planctomycetota bacterium]|nr:hypothetical protein [Planctomycetota bacterium]MDA1113986.1 hypothetical protein [Planctomycetota bacterium]